MLKKIAISSLVVGITLGLLVSGTSAKGQEKIDGKCSITIDANKNTIKNRAKATGKCSRVVTGFYGAGNYSIFGIIDADVKDGDKYYITVMPGFYRYELTIHTIDSAAKPLKTPSVSTVHTKSTKITGSTTAGAKVTVKAGSKTLGSATASSKGNYSVTIKKQKAGTQLKITATKGKRSKTKVVSVQYTAPIVQRVKSSSLFVKGTTVPGAKVTVKASSKIVGTALANKKGSFSVKIKKQKAGVKLNVTAIKGKISSVSQIVTVKK